MYCLVSSETATEPGAHLLLGIKAATRAAYDANVVTSDPDADPLAQHITIIWNRPTTQEPSRFRWKIEAPRLACWRRQLLT